MKKRVPALILALGMTAAPVFAKNNTRRAESKKPSNIEAENTINKRTNNSYIRQKKLELEKEYIREVDEEIYEVLYELPIESQDASTQKRLERPKIVLKEDIPANGIDISDYFRGNPNSA